MAKSVRRLKPLVIARAMPAGLHADGDNLYLFVSPSGAKAWRFIYSFNKVRRELGLGPYPAVSLAEARERVREGKNLLARSLDPKAEWKPQPSVDARFGAIALELIADRKAGWRNAKHAAQWESTLRTYAKPIWDKPVADIGVEDLLAILRPIWMAKAETAKRVRGRIEAVLDAAKVRGLRSGENPAALRGNLALLLARQPSGPRRHHPALPYAELPDFMVELATRPALAAKALEFTILTAARTSEVLQARWAEIDLEAALWVIPATRMKAGREHRVPLPAAAIAIISAIPRAGPFVFPGQKRGKPLSNMAMEMMLRRMGRNDITVHGFRSTFRDWVAEETDFPSELAEHALAHSVGSEVERAYRRGNALERRRGLMEAWAAFARPCPLTAPMA